MLKLDNFRLPIIYKFNIINTIMDEFKRTVFDPQEPVVPDENVLRTKRTRPYLLVLEGPLKGREFQVTKEPFMIGRDRTNDIIIEDPLISRKHASIYFRDGRYRVKDLDSTNGTFLNGEKVSDARLNDKDKIQIAQTVLQFFIGALEF
jgi:pSer/pThr/pTyr-binding forkhead associated (FHA) protein